MAELLNRIDRLALASSGQQQIIGQAQVKFLICKYLSELSFF